METTVRRERDRLQREHDEYIYLLSYTNEIHGMTCGIQWRALQHGSRWTFATYRRITKNGRTKRVIDGAMGSLTWGALIQALERLEKTEKTKVFSER